MNTKYWIPASAGMTEFHSKKRRTPFGALFGAKMPQKARQCWTLKFNIQALPRARKVEILPPMPRTHYGIPCQ
jgi:hypothetical protein